LTFVKTDLGESLTIQIDKDKQFKTDLAVLVPEQRKLLLKSLRKDSGFHILSGQLEARKKTLYSFLEFDREKNKNIFSLEEEVYHPLAFVKQISLGKERKNLPLLLKILEEQPDTIAIEDISQKTIANILFNYVSLSKKVILSLKKDPARFLENYLNGDFDKADLIKNFSLLIEHQSFPLLNNDNREKYFLNKDEEKLIKTFLKENEISEIFKEAGFLKVSKKKLSKIDFSRLKKNKKGFLKKKVEKESYFSEREILGLVEVGRILEKEFIKRHSVEKTKAVLRREIKRALLKNALLASFMGEVDIKSVLKYLTK
jgi:hypothetical protein